jgi:hypothetical protein
VSAAASSPVMVPISGISAISIVLATGPIPVSGVWAPPFA